MTFKYNNVYLENVSTVVGPYEHKGPLSRRFDRYYDEMYMNEDTFENAEIHLMKESIDILLDKLNKKKKDVNLFIAGDLQNQITSSSFSAKYLKSPFLGIYSACATNVEGLIIASSLIENKMINNAIVSVSSHNMVAERQFRNPTEYGAPKKKTTTFTSTGAASLLLTNTKTDIKITSATAGIVQDKGITDVNNMGAVMAIAAADTIKRHLKDLKIDASYYDLILTGDLGIYGKEILIEYLQSKGFDISKNYNDCGLILYDQKKQPVYAGASGPGCSALVLCSYILKEMKKGKYKKVLIVPTGAIFSPTRVFQKSSIPSIAHAISLEAQNKW